MSSPITIRSRMDTRSCPRAMIAPTTARQSAADIPPTTAVATTNRFAIWTEPGQPLHAAYTPECLKA